MKYLKLAAVAVAVAIAIPVGATEMTKPAAGTEAKPATADGQSNGEVRKVDVEQGKVTLKHGPIESLGMPPMTMVFKVADPAMLGKLMVGDKVKFKADRVNGAFTVTEIAPGN